MNTHHLMLIFHLVAAAIWVGGHLILTLTILPEALKKKEAQIILNFEKKYEKIGIPALLILIITGIWMGYKYNATISNWFSFETPIEQVVSAKLVLLFLTFVFALNANFRIIPKLRPETLKLMAFHIISVTIIGLIMLILGSYVRYGGFLN